MERETKDVEFVVFDVETTGLSPSSGDRIIEIAALKIKDGKELGRFHSLVNPGRNNSPAAYAVNHISDTMLKGAPASSAVLPQFLAFCKTACLAGYNVNFDLGFVNHELSSLGKNIPREQAVIDILKMSRSLLRGLSSHSLSSVIAALQFPSPQEHRAMSDVLVTAELLRRFLVRLKTKGIVQFSQLVNLFGVNAALTLNLRQQILSALQRAIDHAEELSIRYFSGSTGEVTRRRIKPMEITRVKGKDMLLAYCNLRKSERTFSLERIIDLEGI